MAFDKETTRTPVEVGQIVVRMYDGLLVNGPSSDVAPKGVEYRVEIVFSDGSRQTRQGDLTPHLTPAQKTSLTTFMNNLRAKAEAEFLP